MMRNKAFLIGYKTTQAYDNDNYNYYQLTPRQANILLSQTDYISWRKRWRNAPNDYDILEVRAEIANQLMNPIEGGFIVTAQELCDAVECGIIKVFERAISGTAQNTDIQISIGDDGKPTLSEFDETKGNVIGSTVSNQEKVMGRSEYIEDQLTQYLNTVEDLYNLTVGDPAEMQTLLGSKYQLINPEIAISAYITFRQASNPQPNPSLVGLRNSLFCEGIAPDVVSTFIIDDALPSKVLRIQLISALSPQQYDLWISRSNSLGLLSDDYLTAPCYRFPTISVTYDADTYGQDLLFPLNPFWGTERIFRVTIRGIVKNDQGDSWTGLFLGQVGQQPTTLLPVIVAVNASGTPSTSSQLDIDNFSFNGGNEYVGDYLAAADNRRLLEIQIPQAVKDWTVTSGSIVFVFEDRGL